MTELDLDALPLRLWAMDHVYGQRLIAELRATRAERDLAVAASCQPEASEEVCRTYSNSLHDRMQRAEAAIARVEALRPISVLGTKGLIHRDEDLRAALRGDR